MQGRRYRTRLRPSVARAALACIALGLITAGCKGNAASFTASCPAAGNTQATLLTPTLANGVAGNYLEYAVSVTDCNNSQITLSASHVLFDVNGNIGKQAEKPISYTMTAGTVTVSGNLEVVTGSDLFGNKGTGYFHYSTDKTIQSPGTALTVHLDMGGLSYVSTSGKGTDQMDTYLAFGDASTVTQTVKLTAK